MNWKNDIQIKEIKNTTNLPLSVQEIEAYNLSIKNQILQEQKFNKFTKLLFSSCLYVGAIGAICMGIGVSQYKKDITQETLAMQKQYAQEIKNNAKIDKTTSEKLAAIDPRLAAQYNMLDTAKKIFFEEMKENKKIADKAIEENKNK